MPKYSSIQKKEAPASSFIPYLCHFSENTILTKKQDLVSIIKVEGFSFEAADDVEIDAKKDLRNNLFKAMVGGNFSIYIHTLRRKQSSYPKGEFDNNFAKGLNKQWEDRHAPEYVFVNEHYITIVRKNNKMTNAMSNLAASFSKDEENSDVNHSQMPTPSFPKMLKKFYNHFTDTTPPF